MHSDAPPSLSPDLDRLAAFGDADGPTLDEALALFARLRLTPLERRAVDVLLARDARTRLPEALLTAAASALMDRGEDAAAARALARATSPSALMLRAELLARAGDPAAAVAMAERVLLRDVDWPGARERHAQWRAQIGAAFAPADRPAHSGSDTIAATVADASYDLLREVGRGGASVVYEARDRDLGRRVALKVYHRPEADRAQLLHEARVAIALAGPGVVRVFDVDPDRGWIALEWAPLGALRSMIRQPRTTDDPAFLWPLGGWAEPVARGLARIHAAAWVHLDVKPGNVLFRAQNAPILADFATARRIGEASPPGSLGYLSPERLAGRPSDARDDIYGFGRVLDDVLDALSEARADGAEVAAWRALAARCTGPEAGRPRDGAELVETVLETGRIRG